MHRFFFCFFVCFSSLTVREHLQSKEAFLKIFLIFVDGLSSADPSSDWNAPAEEWGNWVDEEKVASVPQPEEIPDVQKVKGDI